MGKSKGDNDWMDVDGEGDEGERWGRTKKGKAVKRKIAAESSSSESSPER